MVAAPLKSASGVKSMVSSVGSFGVPPSLTVAVPPVTPSSVMVPVDGPSPPKLSLLSTGMLVVPLSSATVAVSSSAVGTWPCVTLMSTVALLVSPSLSVIV